MKDKKDIIKLRNMRIETMNKYYDLGLINEYYSVKGGVEDLNWILGFGLYDYDFKEV